VSVNATNVVDPLGKFVRFEPSTAGSFAEPSSCTILFALVPTSTFSVAEPEVAPPVKPVPATTAVISPAPVLDGAHLLVNCFSLNILYTIK
jgi:hypothetical protein